MGTRRLLDILTAKLFQDMVLRSHCIIVHVDENVEGALIRPKQGRTAGTAEVTAAFPRSQTRAYRSMHSKKLLLVSVGGRLPGSK